jgi:anti-sigma-K factor RskA
MVHETYKEMLALHALSALDGSEERELQEHLETCALCRHESEQWQATAAALAYVAAPVEPPAELRERILKRIRTEDQATPAEPARVLEFSRPASPTRAPLPWFAAIAAAIIFVALSAGLIVLSRENRAAQRELARLSQTLTEQTQQLALENKIVQALTAPGTRAAELAGTKDAPNAHAVLAVDRQSGRAILVARGLPAPPSGKAYQLWFIASGKPPVPGRVFSTDAAGNAVIEDQLPSSASNASVFAVTLEPKEGVPAPTGHMYLLSPAKGPSPS